MINARQEFLREIEGKALVIAAVLRREVDFDVYDTLILPEGYTPGQLGAFLEAIDFKYDSGYGGQEIEGFIWYADGTWSERGGYDGAGWWEYKYCPDITLWTAPCVAGSEE